MWYPDKGMEFKRKARLFNVATASWNGSVYEGIITMISERGINLVTGGETIFFKWGNVHKVDR
jgi:hypothetical protein